MPLSQTVAVKAETETTFTLAGWAVVFDTDEGTGADLEGEYFTKSSDLWLDKLGMSKPLLYHHGANKAIGKRPIGTARLDVLDEGVWFEAEVEKSGRYAKAIRDLAAAGMLGSSTGAVPHLVEREPVAGKSWLKSWPTAELSLSVQPIEPRTLGVDAIKALAELEPQDEDKPTEVVHAAAAAKPPADVAAATPEPAPITQIEALEPAVEIPHVSDPITPAPAAEAVIAAVETTPDTTATEVKSLRDTIDQLVAKLNDEPAVKAGGIALPAIHLKTDASDEIKAFESWIRGGPAGPALKAMNEGTNSQGGYAVPQEYSSQLILPLSDLSYLRRAGARIVNFSGTNAVHVPSLTHTTAAVLTGEAQAYDEVTPTMGEVVFTPYKYTRIVKVSEELASDSRFDLWNQILSPDFAQAFAKAENSAFTNGTGSSQPGGIAAGAATGVTAASATAPTADEFISTFFALDYKYRDNAKWMMSDGTLAYIRKLKDGASRYLWEPGLNGDSQGLFLGKPVITNNSMDGLTASKDVVLFGDFSYFWIGQWPGLSMQRLSELYAASGQIGFRAFARFDSHIMLADAFTVLTTHA